MGNFGLNDHIPNHIWIWLDHIGHGCCCDLQANIYCRWSVHVEFKNAFRLWGCSKCLPGWGWLGQIIADIKDSLYNIKSSHVVSHTSKSEERHEIEMRAADRNRVWGRPSPFAIHEYFFDTPRPLLF